MLRDLRDQILRREIIRTNLIARVSRIYGHEIHVVLYTCLDGNCRLYKADYVVYILIRLPPN